MRTIVWTILAMIAVIPIARSGEENPLPLKISTKRDNDRVTQKLEKGTATIAVHSPFGISQAVVERVGDKWPEAVIVRLHLKGLENFRVSNGPVEVALAAGIQDGKPVVRQWKDGKEETPLDRKSPYWVDVRILGGDGIAAKEIPLQGYFELRMPRAIFDANPKSITLHWIDFYRT